MRQLAGGISIISAGEGEKRGGFTATSVTSLTLEPPCILVCINRKVSAWPLIQERRRFGVNILAEHHGALAARFAGVGGLKGAARFAEGSWIDGPNGVPILQDALAAVACELEDAIERHSHMILIGAVRAVHLGPRGQPLIYSQGGYGRFEPISVT